MKVALCLVFCVGLALATVDQWRWTENFEDMHDTERYYGSEDRFEQTLFEKKQCKVGSRNLKTFDDEHKQIFLSTGFKVLSKDCSAYPTYAVLMKKLTPTSDLKIVKVATRQNNIVLIPSNEFDQEVKVIVNGRQRLINKNVEIVPCEEHQYLKLVRIGDLVKVILPTSQVVVEFNGRTCSVKVPTTFSQQHCGICNSNKYETSDLFTETDDLMMNDETTDFLGYMTPEERLMNLKDETCKRTSFLNSRCPRRNFFNTVRRNDNFNTEDVLSTLFDDEEVTRRCNPLTRRCNERRNFFDTTEDSEILSTLTEQTVLKRKLIRTEGQICLSIRRVPQCPTNTFPQNEIETRVSYKCVYPEKRLIQKLINKVRSGESLFELDNQINTKTRVEVVPTKCTPTY